MTKAPRPLLLLEINEVPWRLLDRFRAEAERFPHLYRFLDESRTYTTRSTDEGELSPWVTWPSFHRGLPNTEHHVQFLGQDPASFRGTPIWEEYRARGHAVGICGSLQSWPPTDPGPGGFFIPDTFARDERCIPAWTEPFQKFNLKQTGANGRVVNAGSLYSADSLRLAASLPRLGIRPRTVGQVATQLITERVDRTRMARRPVFQAVLLWDIFRKLFHAEAPPAFSTFFTNHVAGVMHRYWDHVFPEDFPTRPADAPRPHLETMRFAFSALDRIIAEALSLAERNPDLLLVFASSMGQGPKVWKRAHGYVLTIPDVSKLMTQGCGLQAGDFEPLLAMVPQICVRIGDPAKRQSVRRLLEGAVPASGPVRGEGEHFFFVEESGDRLSIALVTPPATDVQAGHFTLGGRRFNWADAGIQANAVESGTGYHIPEGTLAIHGRGIAPDSRRTDVRAVDAKALLLELAGLPGRA